MYSPASYAATGSVSDNLRKDKQPGKVLARVSDGCQLQNFLTCCYCKLRSTFVLTVGHTAYLLHFEHNQGSSF